MLAILSIDTPKALPAVSEIAQTIARDTGGVVADLGHKTNTPGSFWIVLRYARIRNPDGEAADRVTDDLCQTCKQAVRMGTVDAMILDEVCA